MSSKNGNCDVVVAQKTKSRIASVAVVESKFQSKTETWTPDKARRQLEMNPNNRPKSDATILEYAQLMESGEWELNGETIKIDTNGHIVDGQHRLEAVVLSNITIESLTVRGLRPKHFNSVDRGRKRTIGHQLFVHGEKNTNALAAAINWVWKYRAGMMRKTGPGSRPRPEQCIQLIGDNPGLSESVGAMSTQNTIISRSTAGAFHYLFSTVNAEKAEAFFNALLSGEGLKKSTGVYTLRDKLIDNKGSKLKMRPLDICAILVKAWNADYNGTPCRVLRYGSDEEFPKIAGLK